MKAASAEAWSRGFNQQDFKMAGFSQSLWSLATPALAAWSLALTVVGAGGMPLMAAEKKVPIQVSGGHETDPRDGGRPVVLIAAGLGVSAEVFREAFRGVTPARGGHPTGDQARANKAALMKVLQPYGISNDRLDQVSNHYRYQPQKGELWKTTPAQGYALVEDGKITKVVISNPGAGYSTPPKITVPGYESSTLKVTLHFDTDLSTNGSVQSVELVPPTTTKN